jgi:photosynthetic reaction center cytochrome c subunit
MTRRGLTLLAAGGFLVLSGCELPPHESADLGFRGVGMQDVANPRVLGDSLAAIAARTPTLSLEGPATMEPAPPGTWENVQVLGHLSEAEFNRFMLAMTIWVAQGTGQGCNYCHVVDAQGQVNFALDDIYTKTVSRQMIRMTQEINTSWTSHVGETGINCWTCHQGEALPTNYWFFADGSRPDLQRHFVNEGTRQIERYYLDDLGMRVQSAEGLTSDVNNPLSTNDTRYSYWVMLQMSESLGVNCTFCHNSGRFADWEESPPTRVQALRGVRMVRSINDAHFLTLQPAWPDFRLGPMGDGPKLQCSTCHIGANRPQYGIPESHGAGWPAITQIGWPHGSNPFSMSATEGEGPATAGN